ncbi:acetate--CoA ligase family protein [Actinomadura rugatobispora]|uniref:Acetate--CoA ligase family protein n=1 Tax=Actinomadura rugatobispora TaxID=1994 RepID=A0ABW1A0Z8_9ACTN|nr:acetate--CoA ligase [Actinomadura rugatobispora]
MTRLYDALLSPSSVAIVGASDTPGKTTARPLEYLRRHGWKGELFPVNPARETVLGERAWPSLGALPVVPDHVFILTGPDLAVEAVRECADLGVTVATVMADDFLDDGGRGAARRAELLEIVRASGLRLLGPSSLGVTAPGDGLALTANAAFAEAEPGDGGVFVASQSGSAMGALLSRGMEMGVGFRGMVSTGNELDLTLGEICLASVDDPRIESYALFLENITGADDLRAFARAAAERGKPVLAYKLGRTDAGARLAVSHTGALAGDDAVADALLKDLGIARVRTFEALLEGQNLARGLPLRPAGAARPRVCVLSTTGGGGAMAVDCLAAAGADLPGPSPETIGRLAEAGIAAGHGALIDLTLAGTRYDVMKSALDVVLAAPEFDAVVAVPGSSARFHPELAVKPIVDCAANGKPLAAFVMPAAPEALRLLRSSGVAAFRTAEACADALFAVFGRRKPAAGDRPGPRPPSADSEILDEAESYEVLGGAGLSCAPHAVVTAGELPPGLPVPGPVAVKILSAEVPHKSDAGGVVLGVTDGDGLRAAADRIARSVTERLPAVKPERFLVQTMARGLGEALVGFRHDPDAGPVVVLAAGGVLAELYQDRSVRPAPVDPGTAREMIGEVIAFRALAGYRGAPVGDLDALARAVAAVSRLADADGAAILEAEVNPLLVLPEGQGVVAVDALVRREREV